MTAKTSSLDRRAIAASFGFETGSACVVWQQMRARNPIQSNASCINGRSVCVFQTPYGRYSVRLYFDRMPGGKCKFQSAWLEHSEYRHWVRPETSDPYRAKCAVCQRSVDIATMGESALKSHQKSAKHRSKVAAGEGCSSVTSFFASGKRHRNDFSAGKHGNILSSCDP